MRIAALILAGALPMLAACSSGPHWAQPVIAQDGSFAGPAVATQGHLPLRADYEDACETGSGKWSHGGWRSYGPCPPRGAVVRASY
jgi:hypothetical protein